MKLTTKGFQDFLDSLSTKGGNILLMLICVFGLMIFTLHVTTHHSADVQLISASHDMLVGFGAALLAVLSGSSSKQQMQDRVDTVVPAGPKVDAGKVETLNITEAPKVTAETK